MSHIWVSHVTQERMHRERMGNGALHLFSILRLFGQFGRWCRCVAVCGCALWPLGRWCSVRCSVLKYVSACCSVLQRVAACCGMCTPLQPIRSLVQVCCSVLQCVAVCCSGLQWLAVACSVRCSMGCSGLQLCNTLKHTTKYCSTLLQYVVSYVRISPGINETPQHLGMHCNTLKYSATHCNTLLQYDVPYARISSRMNDVPYASVVRMRHVSHECVL